MGTVSMAQKTINWVTGTLQDLKNRQDLVRPVQPHFQPLSEGINDHGLGQDGRNMLAQSEKIVCLHDVAGLLHPHRPVRTAAICKSNDGTVVVEPWLIKLHERVHACGAIER